ncbi:hypothetical protein [Vibrio sp. McD22-P3]|uniref:hypothetical protein n=1 Tax=Vibrio sp. McD22-P3 TaxID=2724880 RepID=UPI001F267D04|nr:hypothetical protein [Vibrio sp. McD22-P3]MCF4176137.1 hypothetical protein [Vibrio sp. McD22-P3]
MLELTRFDCQVTKEKGDPSVSGNSLKSWSAWAKQNVADNWSEAYHKLYNTLSSGELSSNYQGVMKTLGQLHN